MKLIIQPEDGIKPLINAINGAKKSVSIVVFRFDLPELEKALKAACKRGVDVHALVAHTTSKGEKSLRKLESRMLEHGATVARTDDDMVRYHGKLMIIDKKNLFVMGFNYTPLDIRRSRSLGSGGTGRPQTAHSVRTSRMAGLPALARALTTLLRC